MPDEHESEPEPLTTHHAGWDGGTTKAVADYVSHLGFEDLDEVVAERARVVLADMLGVMAYSSSRPAVQTSVTALTDFASGNSLVVGRGRVASPETAALVNGIGGHDLEFDDGNEARCHTEPLVVASALAVADLDPAVRVGDMLAGIVAGYDVENRLSKAIGPESMYQRGFHPSTVCGTVGAAATASRILGLDGDKTRYALGLAASQSCGLLTYFDDPTHVSKSFQIGVAARAGITAALLARAGYTSAPDALAGRFDMLGPFGGDGAEPSHLLDELGERFEILETTLKRHAGSGLTHAAVDLLIEMVKNAEFSPDRVKRIEVVLAEKAVPRVDRVILTTHDVRHIVGVAVTQGWVGPRHFEQRWLQDPEVVAMANLVDVTPSDRLQEGFPAYKSAIVRVETDNGTIERFRETPRGHPSQPLTVDEMGAKFAMLAGEVSSPDRVNALWAAVLETPAEDPVTGIYALVENLVENL